MTSASVAGALIRSARSKAGPGPRPRLRQGAVRRPPDQARGRGGRPRPLGGDARSRRGAGSGPGVGEAAPVRRRDVRRGRRDRGPRARRGGRAGPRRGPAGAPAGRAAGDRRQECGALDARRPWLPSLVVKRIDERRGLWMYPAGGPVRERWFRPEALKRRGSDREFERGPRRLPAPARGGRSAWSSGRSLRPG